MNFSKRLYWNRLLLSSCLLAALLTPEFSIRSATSASLEEALKQSRYYENIGNYPKAIQSFSHLEEKQLQNYSIQMRLGYLWQTTGHNANAEFHYKKAKQIAPTAISPALGIMHIYNTQLKYEKTETLAYQLLQTDPNNYYTNMYLTYALRMQNKLELAVKVNQRILTMYPDDTIFLAEMALVYFAQNNINQAGELVHNLLLIDPENTTAKQLHYELLQQITTDSQ